MYKTLLICLLTLLLLPLQANAAPLGLTRGQAAAQYGEHRLGGGDEYGYLTAAADRQVAVWLAFGPDGLTRSATVILDGPVAFRDLGRYFPEVQAIATSAGSQAFVVRGYPRDMLAVHLPGADGGLLLTFLPARGQDATKLNTHSRVLGYTLARPTAAQKELMLMADNDDRRTDRDGSWRRTENFLTPGLHFSEQLVARRRTDMIVIHHTKIENMTVASIHDLHLANGWAGIGYHKVILPDGMVADGRPEYAVGAHAFGANSHSVGISVVGDFDASLPSPAQMASLVTLTAHLAGKYGVSAANIVGHRDVYKNTTCPGKIFPWKDFKQALQEKLPAR